MLDCNTRVLKERFPEVFRRIVDCKDRETLHFKFGKGKSANKLFTSTKQGDFPTYGKGRVENLLNIWFSSLRLEKEAIYSMTGFGDGSHIRHFLKFSSSGAYVLVAEKDPCLLRETFSRLDCSDILSNDRLILGTGLCDAGFFCDLKHAATLKVDEINSIIFSPLHCVDEAYYDQARNEMIRQYLFIRPLVEVNLRNGMILQENTLENLRHMAGSPDVGELEGQFEDTPFILVGAGPSLDESISFLKKMQDKAIICVSNSPLRKLVNSGIRPHLVVTADPMSPTLRGFQNVNTDGIPIACPFSAYPEIVNLFSGRILSWSTHNPLVDILKASTGRNQGTEIIEQGTVSGCVLDLGRLFGCQKIFLVGQDMCIRDDGKYYTDDSSYADFGRHYSSKKEGHLLPGNTLDKVIVEGRLFVYLKTFEKFVEENKNINFINLSRTGVKIKGVPFMTYEQAISSTDPLATSRNFDEKIKDLLDNQFQISDLYTCFEKLEEYVREILQTSLNLVIRSESLPKKYEENNYSKSKELISLIQDGAKVNKLIESDKLFWLALLEGRTKGEIAVYKRLIRDIDATNKNWALIQKNKEYYWALSEGCHWFLNTLIKKLGVSSKTYAPP